jgi:hypothetical protein
MMVRAHKVELREWEKKEFDLVVLGSVWMMLYVVFALITIGFV